MAFSDLVEAFDFHDYLEKFGTIRRSGPTNVVVSTCPLCGDNRWKFYANTSNAKGNGTWNSYCCHDQGGLVKLIAAAEGISRYEAMDLIRAAVEGEEEKIVPLIEATAPVEAPASPVEAVSLPTTPVPSPIYSAAPETPCMMKGELRTLGDRGVSQYIIDRHHLRTLGIGTIYGTDDFGLPARRKDLDNRLLVPIYGPDGELLSWQARDLFDVQKRKYVFPAGDRSSDTFYGWPDAKALDTVLIVEGVFAKWAWDTMGHELRNPAAERFAIASFGKKLSAAQEALLVASPVKRVILGWDLDAASQIAKIAMRLNGRKEILVMPAHPSGRDHDELTLAERVELLGSAKPVTMELLVRLATGSNIL